MQPVPPGHVRITWTATLTKDYTLTVPRSALAGNDVYPGGIAVGKVEDGSHLGAWLADREDTEDGAAEYQNVLGREITSVDWPPGEASEPPESQVHRLADVIQQHEHGPYASYGCQHCPATGKGYETIPQYQLSTGEILAEARRALHDREHDADGHASDGHASDGLSSAFRALDTALSRGDELPAEWRHPALPSRQALTTAIRPVPPGHAMITPATEPAVGTIPDGLTGAQPAHDDIAAPSHDAGSAAEDEDDGYTVIGVWLSDEPVPVGVITGRHSVEGGDDQAFPEGLWATHVSAGDTGEAETAAIQEMTDA